MDEQRPYSTNWILTLVNSRLARYGVVTKHVCSRLKKQGYDISVLAFYGCEGSAIVLDGLTVYPKMFSLYGQDAAQMVVRHLKPDLFITLFDIWVMPELLPRLETRWAPYCPVDHSPIPEPVFLPLTKSFQPIAMSKHGLQMMKDAHVVNPIYIPHGVDTKIFKPTENKHDIRHKVLSRFEDSFIVGINAANKGLRKEFPRMLGAFKLFLERNPEAKKDSYIYLNAWIQFPEGLDLKALVKYFELGKNTIVVNEWKKYCGMSEPEMADWYNCCDVFINLARGEGFGIPILESQACGVPVIATEFSSMIELVKGHGWLVPARDMDMSYLLSYMALADINMAADFLEESWKSPSKRHNLGMKARAFSMNYDYDEKILPMWTRWIDEVKGSATESFDKPNVELIK